MWPRKSFPSSTSRALPRSKTWSVSPVHPLRFRANVYVRGWPAWHEAGLLGETLAIGPTRLKVVKRITRCPAVNVDPELAVRDMEIPNTLMRSLGHNECGIYAEVIEGGEIAVGDQVAIETAGAVIGHR